MNFEITPTGTPPVDDVWLCTSQTQPSAKVMPVSGGTNTPAGSMPAVNTGPVDSKESQARQAG